VAGPGKKLFSRKMVVPLTRSLINNGEGSLSKKQLIEKSFQGHIYHSWVWTKSEKVLAKGGPVRAKPETRTAAAGTREKKIKKTLNYEAGRKFNNLEETGAGGQESKPERGEGGKATLKGKKQEAGHELENLAKNVRTLSGVIHEVLNGPGLNMEKEETSGGKRGKRL